MTNSWNTPTEVLEETYPVRVNRYAIRHNSGGAGRHRGGDGIVRELEFLVSVEAGLLSDRRAISPYGLNGGHDGSTGRSTLSRKSSMKELPAKCSFAAHAGDILRIETPGGGGWGTASRKQSNRAKQRKRSR